MKIRPGVHSKVAKVIVLLAIGIGVALFYLHYIELELRNRKTYNFFELSMSFKHYQVVDKTILDDSCYYLELKSPIDTKETKVVKVKDYVYLRTFVNDVIK